MKRFALFLLLFLLGCTSCTSPWSQKPADEPKELTPRSAAIAARSKVVALVEAHGGKNQLHCSAVWISPRKLVTAGHCVEDLFQPECGKTMPKQQFFGWYIFAQPEEPKCCTPDPMKDPALVGVGYLVEQDIVDKDRKEHEAPSSRAAYVRYYDEEHDLAILESFGTPPDHLIATVGTDASEGDRVHVMGHPAGLWWSFSSGEIASIRMAEHDIDRPLDPLTLWIQTTAPISGGNSGGGLFDERGLLLGIASRSRTRGQNLNFFVHAQHVANAAGIETALQRPKTPCPASVAAE